MKYESIRMTTPSFLKQLAAQLSEAMPSHLGTLKSDMEKNCQAILSKAFAKLDLVTREEFDAQTKVLARTRKKLEALEKKLSELESHKRKKSE